MTLKRVPCPIPSLSLKNEWSGKVLAMSRLIIRSQAELLYTNNGYCTLYMCHDTTTKKTPGKNSYNLIKLFICKTSTCSRLKCLKHQIWAWIKKLYTIICLCQFPKSAGSNNIVITNWHYTCTSNITKFYNLFEQKACNEGFANLRWICYLIVHSQKKTCPYSYL